MTDLSINKSIAMQPQEQGHQNVTDNSIIGKIQSSNVNKQLYASFLRFNNSYPLDTYKKEEKNKKIILSIAGGVTLLLGGAGVILGRKNIFQLRGKLNQSIEFMQGLKDSKHFEVLSSAKLAVTKVLSNVLGYIFTFDKVKDFSLLKGFESLGKPGKIIIEASKGSLWITEKRLGKLYKSFKGHVISSGKSVEKALTMPNIFSNEQEKQLVERLNILLNGNKESKGLIHFADDLMTGLKERTGRLKNTVQKENIEKYREKYYPKTFKLTEFKRVAANWREYLFTAKENKDVLRENWAKTEEILLTNIDKTGANSGKIKNFGQAREYLISITKEIEELHGQSNCSDEFKNLVKQVKNLNEKINISNSVTNTKIFETNPIIFETSGEKYAGRVLDLAAGGGMSETLIPPVAGGLVAYHTLKDSKPEERKEKFIRSNGPELIGGLAGWMVTSNLLAISGATGMVAGLVTAGIMNIAGRSYLRHLEKNKKQNTQV
ncbi:MAG TPA: hypothetical protein DDW90_03435 [Cyanobacteria bacterium UBA9971]|nr:hypothetical protein [Cyanobacteria bacterium UBA9971]